MFACIQAQKHVDFPGSFTIRIRILLYQISTSNYMFGRAIWDKLPECIFENFDIARVQ